MVSRSGSGQLRAERHGEDEYVTPPNTRTAITRATTPNARHALVTMAMMPAPAPRARAPCRWTNRHHRRDDARRSFQLARQASCPDWVAVAAVPHRVAKALFAPNGAEHRARNTRGRRPRGRARTPRRRRSSSCASARRTTATPGRSRWSVRPRRRRAGATRAARPTWGSRPGGRHGRRAARPTAAHRIARRTAERPLARRCAPRTAGRRRARRSGAGPRRGRPTRAAVPRPSSVRGRRPSGPRCSGRRSSSGDSLARSRCCAVVSPILAADVRPRPDPPDRTRGPCPPGGPAGTGRARAARASSRTSYDSGGDARQRHPLHRHPPQRHPPPRPGGSWPRPPRPARPPGVSPRTRSGSAPATPPPSGP